MVILVSKAFPWVCIVRWSLSSLVGLLAGVDPLVVDVDGLREEVDGGLEVLHAHVALDPARVLGLLHLDLAALLVVAEGAVEHDVQGLDRLALGAGAAFGLSTTHHEREEGDDEAVEKLSATAAASEPCCVFLSVF